MSSMTEGSPSCSSTWKISRCVRVHCVRIALTTRTPRDALLSDANIFTIKAPLSAPAPLSRQLGILMKDKYACDH